MFQSARMFARGELTVLSSFWLWFGSLAPVFIAYFAIAASCCARSYKAKHACNDSIKPQTAVLRSATPVLRQKDRRA